MKNLFLITAVLLLTNFKMTAQNILFEQAKLYLEAFQSKVKIPEKYYFHSVNKVTVDAFPAYLFRY